MLTIDVHQSGKLFFGADARRTSALVTERSQNWGHSAKLSCPMREDVKKKVLPLPPGETWMW
jgi:hypothetical protein